jgi:uncharacterized membrane protein YphA (DoxX/SURF4 family)
MIAKIDGQLFWVILVLPALFAVIFFVEGVHKWLEKEESPYPSWTMGFIFLGVIMTAYFLLFGK